MVAQLASRLADSKAGMSVVTMVVMMALQMAGRLAVGWAALLVDLSGDQLAARWVDYLVENSVVLLGEN